MSHDKFKLKIFEGFCILLIIIVIIISISILDLFLENSRFETSRADSGQPMMPRLANKSASGG